MSGVSPISLQANDFELFDLPARFELDSLELAKRWKALQALTHQRVNTPNSRMMMVMTITMMMMSSL